MEAKMIFKDEHNFSLFPKLLFMASIITVSLLVSYLTVKDVSEEGLLKCNAARNLRNLSK